AVINIDRGLVSSAGQAREEAIANKLVVARSGDNGHVLDARAGTKGFRRQSKETQEQAGTDEAAARKHRSERRHLFPNPREPSLFLCVGNSALGNVLDRGIGNIVAVNR